MSFTIGPVPVWIDFNFRLDVGVELDIEVTANVTTEATIHAEGSFDYTCTRSSCSGTNTFGSDDFQFGEVNAGLEARLKAQAWAEPMLGAEVWKNPFVDILKGEVGLRGLVEADIWGYFGSTCGDADGDGTNETVKALAADLQWGYDVRYNYEILEHRVERTEPGPRYPLGWWDVLERIGQGKSTALQPMVLGPAEVPTATGQSYTFRMRPCYPYSEHVNFEVNGNWTGVKTIPEPQSTDPALNSSILSRVFNQPGIHQVTAVTVVDGKGREIDVPYTREVLAIAPVPPPPPPQEIRVRVAGGSQVPDGGAYTFPRTHVSNLPLDRTFEIWNDGGVDLTIQNPGALVSGDGFTQVGSAASVVPPGGHTTFKVRFAAASPWMYSGAVRILNDDADEGVYDVALSGRALGTCAADATTLCLQGGRFKVRVDYGGGAGKAVAATELGGFFGFANTTNLEVGVKVLQPPSGNWWVFHGPATHLEYTVTVYDTVTGNDKTYTKSHGSFCGDTGILPGGGSSALAAAPLPAKSGSAGNCAPSGSAVCLNNDRFRVEVLRDGSPQPAVELTTLTGVFSFATEANPEVFVKVLGPVGGGGGYWVFYGALTDQSYTVRVTDTAVSPNEVVTYTNPQGNYCGGADTNAF